MLIFILVVYINYNQKRGLKMSNLVVEIVTGLITVIGVAITALVSFITLRRQSWQRLVSESRNHWLNEFRNEFSIVVGTIKIIQNKKYNGYFEHSFIENVKDNNNGIVSYDYIKMIHEGEIAKAKLLTRLNTNKFQGNEYNFALERILLDLRFEYCYLESFQVSKLHQLVNLILESEWNKVKSESKGEL